MSAQIKNGGPAFPCEQHETQDGLWNQTFESGMTLRDYFAAKELSKVDGAAICDHREVYARIANHCYRMADAMLAERVGGAK